MCFRKLGRFLTGFTESNRNRIYCVWEALHREFITVGEIKVTIMQNHTRSFYESVRDAFNRCTFKDDESICYWDLYAMYSCSNAVANSLKHVGWWSFFGSRR